MASLYFLTFQKILSDDLRKIVMGSILHSSDNIECVRVKGADNVTNCTYKYSWGSDLRLVTNKHVEVSLRPFMTTHTKTLIHFNASLRE